MSNFFGPIVVSGWNKRLIKLYQHPQGRTKLVARSIKHNFNTYATHTHTQGVNPAHISIHTCISIDSSTCRGSGSSIERFIQLASMRLPCFHIHICTSWVYSLLYTICIYLSVLSIYDFVVSQILRLRRLYITDPGRNTCEAFLNSIATLLCVCVSAHGLH